MLVRLLKLVHNTYKKLFILRKGRTLAISFGNLQYFIIRKISKIYVLQVYSFKIEIKGNPIL